MATSGVTNFNPTVVEIIEEAYERTGKELRTGYDLRTARRSLNILALEWANRGLNLWTVDQASLALVAGTATYALPGDTIDIIEAVNRTGTGTSQFDLTMSRISVSDYANISVKNSTGRPVQYYVSRTSTPSVTVWPVPDSALSYTFVYWRLRRIQDPAASGGANTLDLPGRFIPAIISGLAYQLAGKSTDAAVIQRLPLLKAAYEEEFNLAAAEDRDRASVYLVPYMDSYDR